jgi:hypothetical protein
MFHTSCVYGTVFESILPRTNETLPGRDRASHPFVLETRQAPGAPTGASTLEVGLLLLGPGIPALPYLFEAIKRGGESGVLRERVPYRITDLREGETSILLEKDAIDLGRENAVWEYRPCRPGGGAETGGDGEREAKGTEEVKETKFLVQLLSPLRFKAGGRYTHDFDAGAFAACLHRRMQTLTTLYGSNDCPGDYRYSGAWTITANRLIWRDETHYSGRQKTALRLGGALGELEITGRFSPYERALLDFGALFHGGKNTNFGLGEMRVEEG